MKKTSRYTILTMLLAVAISLGSMACLNLILRAREGWLLSANGAILAGSMVNEWQKRQNISVRQIEEVIKSWDKGMTAHDPVNGQISMEEAIRAGRAWFTKMDLEEYDRERDEKARIHSAYAMLRTLEEPAKAEEKPYYSFWEVRLSGGSVEAVLYVNAVTAGVWQAKVKFHDNLPEEMPYWKLKSFMEFNGLTPYYKGAARNEEGTKAVWEDEDSRLCARMEFAYGNDSHELPDSDDGGSKAAEGKGTCAVMTLELAVRKETKGNERP